MIPSISPAQANHVRRACFPKLGSTSWRREMNARFQRSTKLSTPSSLQGLRMNASARSPKGLRSGSAAVNSCQANRSGRELGARPEVRLTQFPGEPLRVDGTHIRCTVCRRSYKNRWSDIRQHVATELHIQAVEKAKNRRCDDSQLKVIRMLCL